MRSDIEVPLFQVAIGPRVDGRIDKRLRVSRQSQRTVATIAHRIDDLDLGDRIRPCFPWSTSPSPASGSGCRRSRSPPARSPQSTTQSKSPCPASYPQAPPRLLAWRVARRKTAPACVLFHPRCSRGRHCPAHRCELGVSGRAGLSKLSGTSFFITPKLLRRYAAAPPCLRLRWTSYQD